MPTTLPGYFTVTEAADRLGYKAPNTVRRLCIANRIPGAIKVGKMWLIPEIWVFEQEKIGPIGIGNRGVSRK